MQTTGSIEPVRGKKKKKTSSRSKSKKVEDKHTSGSSMFRFYKIIQFANDSTKVYLSLIKFFI